MRTIWRTFLVVSVVLAVVSRGADMIGLLVFGETPSVRSMVIAEVGSLLLTIWLTAAWWDGFGERVG